MKNVRILFILLFSFSLVVWVKNVEASLDNESIVGGTVAIVGEHKYQVSVQVEGHHTCGGGILSEQLVLTAAHCLFTFDNSVIIARFTVVAGIINVNVNTRSTIRIPVQKSYVPREYSATNPNPENNAFRETGDIAILKLRDPLDFISRSAHIGKLNLPEAPYSNYVSEDAVIAGFGYEGVVRISRFEELPTINNGRLKRIGAKVTSHEVCERHSTRSISDKHLCAKSKQTQANSAEGVCTGDSGSPLVINDDIVIGILSYGPFLCDERVIPAVYTRVTSFITFIQNVMDGISSSDIRSITYPQFVDIQRS